MPPQLRILPRMLHGCADLRLAVVSPFVDRRHGTERALAELLERLARTYHCEIHLYANRVEDLSLNHSGGVLPPGTGGIFWHKVPSVPGPHLLQFSCWFYFNRLWRWAHTFFRGTSFDLVLSPGINSPDADVILVHVLFHRLRELSQEKAMGAPLGIGQLSRIHRRVYYAFLAALEHRIYTNPNVSLAAVSRHTAELLRNYFGRQDVRVIPNGVDASRFSPAARLALRGEARRGRDLQENNFVLLLIGNDWRVKGLPTVLHALAALRGSPVHLIVVGSDASASFRASADSLGVLDRCHFEAPRQDVLSLYAATDLYVSPSLEDSFGLPVAEAMACGLPVITSVFSGVAEFIHGGINGFVLRDPGNSQALAQLLDELIRDPERRRHIGEAAAKTALEWGWDRNARAVYSLLQDAAAQKRKSGAAG